MKKKLILALSGIFSTLIYAETPYRGTNIGAINSDAVLINGRSFMRAGIINNYYNREGVTSSIQNIGLVTGVADSENRNNYAPYHANTRGLILGTTSNFQTTKTTNKTIGVSFGELHSRVSYENLEGRENIYTSALNSYFGFDFYKNITVINLSLSKTTTDSGHSGKDKTHIIGTGIEQGRVIPFGKRMVFYPYINLDYKEYYLGSYEINGEKYDSLVDSNSTYKFGISISADKAKIFSKANIYSTHTFKEANKSRGNKPNYIIESNNSVDYTLEIGYYADVDLVYSLEYKNTISDNYNVGIIGTKVRYAF